MAEATLRPASAPALFDAAFPRLLGGLSAPLRGMVLALAGSLLLILSAKVQVPMWPVPMTMQSFVVLFLGAALGPRLGAATVALYLGQGLAGLPVFAMPGAAGPAYFLGTTGGFLLSFIPAAWVAGIFAQRGASLLRVAGGMALAHALILGLGMLWLAYLAQLASGATGIGLERAFAVGVQPFVLGSLVKVALATALVAAGWTALRRR
ncbi:MAG: biotin transporter BioY [Beijerinckiaceae bacterium]|jgi:biotin transport system substrate-specific component|nr:biotin transporter BioY [Beijerinckiaceae bacterium]